MTDSFRYNYRAFFRLVLLSLRLRPWRYCALSLAIGFGALALSVGLAIGLGPSRAIQSQMEEIFPEQRLVLKPATVDVLVLSVESTLITEATLEKVAAIEGVKRVSPEITVRFPLRAEGALFGMTYSTDLTVTGVEPWVLGDKLPDNFWWEEGKRDWIPAIFSQYFLDLYNMALAESNGLPKLSPQAAIGRDFWVVLGESSIRPSKKDTKLRYEECRIVGLSDNPDLLGLLLPIEAVRDFNHWRGFRNEEYRALHVELSNPEAAGLVEAEAEKLGLRVPDRATSWRKAVLISRIAGSVVAALGAMVLALAWAYVLLSTRVMLREWRLEIAIWRATGASMKLVRRVVVTSLLCAGAMGTALGLAGAYGVVIIGAGYYERLQSQWAFLPPGAIQLPVLWALGVAIIIMFSVALTARMLVGSYLREHIADALWQGR